MPKTLDELQKMAPEDLVMQIIAAARIVERYKRVLEPDVTKALVQIYAALNELGEKLNVDIEGNYAQWVAEQCLTVTFDVVAA